MLHVRKRLRSKENKNKSWSLKPANRDQSQSLDKTPDYLTSRFRKPRTTSLKRPYNYSIVDYSELLDQK